MPRVATKLLSVLTGLLFAGQALAQAAGGTSGGTGGAIGQAAPMMSKIRGFFNGIGDPVTTYLLNTMFGPIFAGGTTKTVLSVIAGPINLVIVVLAALLIIYNFIWGAASTAHEGELMGRRTHSFWAPVRMALAFLLLIPIPTVGGYNTGQVLIAWLVKGSTATATYVWQTATQAITTQGVTVTGVINPGVSIDVARAAWNMTVCEQAIASMYTLAQANSDPAQRIANASVWASDGPFTPSELAAAGFGGDPTNGVGLGVGAGYGQKFFVSMPTADQPRRLFGVCGAIATPDVPDALVQGTATGGAQAFADFIAAHKDSIKTLLDAYRQPAANLVKAVLENKKNDSFQPTYFTQPIANSNTALSAAIKNLLPSAQNQSQIVSDYLTGKGCSNTDPSAPLAELSGNCIGTSWIGAGGFYLAMSQASQNNIVILMASSSVVGTPTWVQRATSIFSSQGVGSSVDLTEKYTQISTQADLLWGSVYGVSSPQGGSPVIGEGAQTRSTVTGIIYDNTVGPIKAAALDNTMYFVRSMKAAASFLTSPNSNPVVAAAAYGQYAAMILSAFMTALVGIGFVNTGASVFAAMLIIPLAVSGFLGFVMPLLPYVYWNLAVAGYVVIIAEAVFAAAIWATAHIRTEGEGITGSAQAGYLILLALTLTPILMVVGIFVGMATLMVGGTIVNLTIGSVIATIPANMFTFIVGFVFIVGTIVYLYWMLIEKAFTLVGEFPHKIFHWFGHNQSPLTKGEEREARLALVGATYKMAGVVPSMGATMEKAMEKRRERLSGKGNVGDPGQG